MKTIGLTTANKNKLGYLVIDYDKLTQEEVEEDTNRLIKEEKLNNCVLVKTKRGYHCHYFWDNRLAWERIKEIIDKSNACKDFKKFKEEVNFSRIRIKGEDLKIIKLIKSEFHMPNDLGNFYFNMYINLISSISSTLFNNPSQKVII